MRTRVFAVFATLLVLAGLSLGQNGVLGTPGGVAGRSDVQKFGQWTAKSKNGVSSGSASMTMAPCYFSMDGSTIVTQFFPLVVGGKVLVNDGTSTETVTITAVSSPVLASGSSYPGGFSCGFTGTFASNHTTSELSLSTGDFGVNECVNVLKKFGGVCAATPGFGGAATDLSTGVTTGSALVSIEDLAGVTTGGSPSVYTWNGTAYQLSDGAFVSANFATLKPFVNEELLTLSTGGTTTDTTANLLPANSIILSATARVTTAISGGTCSAWGIGDPTTATRFTPTTIALTANTLSTTVVPLYIGANIGSATTGIWQTGANKVRVTCATGAPGAGAVRITIMGYTLSAPAQ